MAAARQRFDLIIPPEVQAEDLREVPEAAVPFLVAALKEIRARRDGAAKAKTGALGGTCSGAFWADEQETRPSGRIIYTVEGHTIEIIAIHADHDEAYRRARARFRTARA